jgi:alpha-2-macroglobulin
MDNNIWSTLKRYRFLVAGCGVIALLVAAGGGIIAWRLWQRGSSGTQVISVEVDPGASTSGSTAATGEGTPMSVRLSAGEAQPQEVTPMPVSQGDPLTEDELNAILERLPELTPEPDDYADFRLALDPIPPPLTGDTVDEPFPVPEQPVAPVVEDPGPLEVLRFAPEGEIPIAPFVQVTFNQPMVPLDTLEGLSNEEVPVRLEPALPGTWRWLGVKTLTFEYDSDLIDRLPKATEYTVTIPAGTSSQSGGVLAEEVSWTFRTPPVKVISTYPYDEPQPVEPLFFIAFDQRIDPAAVLETIQVTAGSQKVSLVLATQAQIDADKAVSSLSKNAQEGRWLAFRAQEPFHQDTAISVTIGPGTPSAEGPLLMEQAFSYGFRTYAPLKIVEHGCSWGGNDCTPMPRCSCASITPSTR